MVFEKAGRIPHVLRYRHLPRAASRARETWTVVANRQGEVTFGAHCLLGPGFELRMPGPGTFRAGRGVEFRRDFVCEIGGDGLVEIGDGCAFTYGTVIQCSSSVVIEEGCAIGRCMILDGNHRYRDPGLPTWKQGYDLRPVRIGAGTLVGSFATVMADIGRNCFIGAGAVVTEPIPDFSLAVGAPARVVDSYAP